MQRILSTLKQAFRQSILIVCLMSLLSLSGLFIFETQPSLAATSTGRQTTLDKNFNKANQSSQNAANREEAYEEAIEAVDNPKGLENEYEKNLKAYEEKQPNKGLAEGAKELVERVTESIP